MNGFTWRTVLIKATLIRKIHELNKDNANEKKGDWKDLKQIRKILDKKHYYRFSSRIFFTLEEEVFLRHLLQQHQFESMHLEVSWIRRWFFLQVFQRERRLHILHQ